MSYRPWALAIIAALLVFGVSCAKIKQPLKEGAVTIEKLEATNSIPASWGKLISVTYMSNVADEREFQLWFQSEKGDIHMVTYDMRSNSLIGRAKLIPQK